MRMCHPTEGNGHLCNPAFTFGLSHAAGRVLTLTAGPAAGAGAAHRVDFASEIDPSWCDGVETVGLTSGASVPEILVREVVERLAEFGFDDVEEVRTTTEKISFSLPKNLRADLMAAQGAASAHKRREPAADHTC